MEYRESVGIELLKYSGYSYFILLVMQEISPLEDYALLSVIGKGSYAKVVLVRKKATGQLFALKSMKKKYIQQKGQDKRVMMEREILAAIDHPFLIHIHASFQDQKKLFLVLEYCPGGELFGLLSRRKRLTENETRFYAAQLVLVIEYLHKENIIYRDLKPENVLIDAEGYLKVTDFGLSRNNVIGDQEAFSVCGTPEYLAPEVIKKEGHGRAVDWWCLGSLIYELVHGLPPFYCKNRAELFDKIKNGEPYLNKNWSNHLKDLFRILFLKNPQSRLQKAANIRQHPWFGTMDWELLEQKKIKPPFMPVLHGDNDLSHFAKEFTCCSVESNVSSYNDCKKFEGFSYEHSLSPPEKLEEEQEEKLGEGEKLDEEEKLGKEEKFGEGAMMEEGIELLGEAEMKAEQ